MDDLFNELCAIDGGGAADEHAAPPPPEPQRCDHEDIIESDTGFQPSDDMLPASDPGFQPSDARLPAKKRKSPDPATTRVARRTNHGSVVERLPMVSRDLHCVFVGENAFQCGRNTECIIRLSPP